MELTIGPYHPDLPGPMKVQFLMDGEIITDSKIELGFCHRNIEKTLESKTWFTLMSYVDRADPEGSLFHEHAASLALEQIHGIEVTPRAEFIRGISSELNRVSSHLVYLSKVARAAGMYSAMHYMLRDRERVLDLLELLTGARFMPNYFRFGGVRLDVTEGFLERIIDLCDWVLLRIKEYNDLITYHHSFLTRTENVGILSEDKIRTFGITGPNARAGGVSCDWRMIGKYGIYPDIEPKSEIIETGSDCHARFRVRMRELEQSTELLRQMVRRIPGGPLVHFPMQVDFTPKRGESMIRVEGAQGVITWHMVSDGKKSPSRIKVQGPSQFVFPALDSLFKGVVLEDVGIVLASLDLNVVEADQ